jgi:hypothetical protein
MGRKHTDIDKSTDLDSNKPTWNTSPNSLPGYFNSLTEWLQTQDADYTSLVQYGYVINGRYVCCVSQNHIDRVVMGNIDRGNFKKPCTIGRSDFHPFPASTDTPYSKMKADGSPDLQYARYVVNPEKIEQCDMALATEIRNTITAAEYGRNLMASCSDSGRQMLVHLKQKVDNMPTNITNYGASITAKIDNRLRQGILAPTVSAFMQLVEDVTTQCDLLPADLKGAYSNAIIATKLQDSARGLGPIIYSEINSELRNMPVHASDANICHGV